MKNWFKDVIHDWIYAIAMYSLLSTIGLGGTTLILQGLKVVADNSPPRTLVRQVNWHKYRNLSLGLMAITGGSFICTTVSGAAAANSFGDSSDEP